MRVSVAVCLHCSPQTPKSCWRRRSGGLWVSQRVCFNVINLLCGPALPSPAGCCTHASVTSLCWVGEPRPSLWSLPHTADSQLGGAQSLSWKRSGRMEAIEVCGFSRGHSRSNWAAHAVIRPSFHHLRGFLTSRSCLEASAAAINQRQHGMGEQMPHGRVCVWETGGFNWQFTKLWKRKAAWGCWSDLAHVLVSLVDFPKQTPNLKEIFGFTGSREQTWKPNSGYFNLEDCCSSTRPQCFLLCKSWC